MNNKFLVTRSIDIQYAHRVMGHNGKCGRLHGRRGTVEVAVVGNLECVGSSGDMVMDFGDIESALEIHVKNFLCHRTILQDTDPVGALLGECIQESFEFGQSLVHVVEGDFATCVILPYKPTARTLGTVVL